ncbi:uncharacterized protein LOC116346286 isoform X2 [Contarinia nasturtii]|uniref:uncharacterized protein LOC116346286 isoform X2 n=1 Tax=Contarinia nasturtii TaxID=265458 RepID=UPI0012D46E3D|nr:uncharacterized protein LOC116346286 isoform X2 [Contarinia nasturtii]
MEEQTNSTESDASDATKSNLVEKGAREEEKENEKTVDFKFKTPKHRNSSDGGVENMPFKRMKFTDFQNVSNRMSKIMVPFTFGYDGSKKTIQQSKIGRRRMSQWSVQSIHDEDSVVVDMVHPEPAVENKSQKLENEKISTSESLNGVHTEPIEEVNLIEASTVVKSPDKSQPKAASILYRRKSARFSASGDNLGSLFIELDRNKDVDIESTIEEKSNHFESPAEGIESSNNHSLPQIDHDKTVSQIEAEENGEISQNNRQENVSELLTKHRDDNVKLWQTRNKSISDPLFHCFDLVEKLNTNTIKVACLLCDPMKDPLTIKVGSNSNLKAHLKRMHTNLYEELKNVYDDQKMIETDGERKAKRDEIQDLILKFVIKERLPLQKVESKHLNRLIEFCLNGRRDVNKNKNDESSKPTCFLTRKVARQKIRNFSIENRTRIKERLKAIKFISATSDIWSSNNRSYIAVSTHYINTEKGTIETEFLASRRFRGSHNNEAVAEILKLIFNEYEIAEKVFFITTDGAGEYKCAMARFGDNYKSLIPLLHLSEGEDIDYHAEPDIDSDSDSEEEISDCTLAVPDFQCDAAEASTSETGSLFIVKDILSGALDVQLPTRIDCSSHLFDKIGSKDSFDAVLDDTYCDKYSKVMDKLNLIWNVTQSRLKTELFEKYTESKLVKPHRIRWNKLYDAIERILSINEVKLKAACTVVTIPVLDKDDYTFLNEYMKVIQPIAEALKALEGNRDTFGSYLPTLFGLKFKLDELKKTRLKFCKPLLQNVCDGFSTRFCNMMDLNSPKSIPLYMAMVTNPSFKLNYLSHNTPMSVLKKIQNMLLKAAEELANDEKNDSPEGNCTEPATIVTNKLATSFLIKNDVSSKFKSSMNMNFNVVREINTYLGSPCNHEYEYLNQYPNIKQLFLKFNCIRSSEAICERMFSYAGMIFTDKRRKMTDDLFESLLLLHMNNWE